MTGANLSNCNLRFGRFSGTKMVGCSLSRSDLTKANLVNSSLIDSELIESKFTRASLKNALLPGAKALGTIFRRTDLTGACIANWQINSETSFQDLICEHIYLDYFYKKNQPTRAKRIPSEASFQENDFENIMNQYFNLAEMIFRPNILNQSDSGVEHSKKTFSESEATDFYGAIPTGLDPETLSRLELNQTISRLAYPQFSQLEMMIKVPFENRTGSSENGGERAANLLAWAESPLGCGLEKVRECLALIKKTLRRS
ncbi:pentapeptide repeat-containing protein [bacterium]|nr:pentapeptide repeat-containing protein [bacterium]